MLSFGRSLGSVSECREPDEFSQHGEVGDTCMFSRV